MGDKKSVAWKQRERDVAKFFGSRGRTPLSGMNSKHTGADILDDTFYVEVKLRAKHAAMTLLREVVLDAAKEQKKPVVALCEGHKPGFGILVRAADAEDFAVALLTRLGYTVKKGVKRAHIS